MAHKWCNRFSCWCDDVTDIMDFECDEMPCWYECDECEDCEEVE